MKKEFDVGVDVVIRGIIRVKGENEEKALSDFIGEVNSYTVDMKSKFNLDTIDRKVHTFDAHDMEIDYTGIEEVFQELLKNKNTA